MEDNNKSVAHVLEHGTVIWDGVYHCAVPECEINLLERGDFMKIAEMRKKLYYDSKEKGEQPK